MSTSKWKFEEITRISLTEKTDLVLSWMTDTTTGYKSIFFNKQNSPNASKAFKSTGVAIPVEVASRLAEELKKL